MARCFSGSREIAARTTAAVSLRITCRSAASARPSVNSRSSIGSVGSRLPALRFRQTFTATRYSQVPNAESDLVLQAIADDGRAFRVAPAGEGVASGDPAAVLAAAMYWELPPAYVRRLRERAGVAEARAEDEEE